MTTLPRHAHYIAGEWTAGSRLAENVNPSDLGDVIAQFPLGDEADASRAVDAARAAFPAWASTTPQQRADILERAGLLLAQRAQDLGTLLAREEGKTLSEAVGEVLRAAQIFKFFAQEALRIAGEAIQSVRPGVEVLVLREPVGVVALVTPWNFPIAIPAWKMAPALACGNTVVLKPAELTPASACALVAILVEAGCPAGVVNLVLGTGGEVGAALVEHPEVDAVSFTGSVAVGRAIAATAARTLKKVQLEMGGKNPMVIMDDADLDTAVAASLNGAFFSTGQRCTASSRLIVQSGIHDAFVDRLTEAMLALRVGPALDAATAIGPVVSAAQLERNLDYVALAAREGAEVIGGQRLQLEKPGHFQAPALFLGTDNVMRVAREEIFGPCAAVIRFDDYEQGLAIANDTPFGLVAGICTTGLRHARDFRRRARTGMVMVNLPTAGVDYHVPFGGRRGSSYGPREQGRMAVDFYTVVKTAYELA